MTEPVQRFAADRALWRSVGRAAAAALLVDLVLIGVGRALRLHFSAALLVGLSVVIVVLAQLIRSSLLDQPPVEQAQPASTSTPEYFIRLRQVERRLENASTDAVKFEWNVRPMLVELATQRLYVKHGVRMAYEPDKARRIVGEQLWQIMTPAPDTPVSSMTAERLRALVAAIERI